ncbi:MAG: hypothetical protein WHS38_03385 [Thermodesulforhabdaceae bacterium]
MTDFTLENRLAEYLSRFSMPAIAFSGGMDSGFLVWFVRNKLKKRAVVICAKHVLIPSGEEVHRSRMLEIYGWTDAEFLSVDLLSLTQVMENRPDRCYACKKLLMGTLLDVARARGCDGLLDGTTADEKLGYRPGVQALKELGIRSPFAEIGLTKDNVREFARAYELVFADKPPESCLATRFPYNYRLELSFLRTVDAIEDKLKSIIKGPVRARIHPDARLVRIEADLFNPQAELSHSLWQEVSEIARRAGFRWVTVDVNGFRSGSWDEELDVSRD